MEMGRSPPVAAKKLWSIVRIVLFMLKKGKYNAGKAISNLVFHQKVQDHLSSFSCRSNDALSFVSPRDYEFSCSNSPAFHHHHHHRRRHHYNKSNYRYDDVTTFSAVQKVLEMLNNEAAAESSFSPMVSPGFGRSPLGRQLRVTDSPFPLKDDGDSQVDMAAEEFINKFYKDLKLQKIMSAFESPSHNRWER
ncbi:hypothetical protein F3Y22_tig00110247pilonHSYRG00079 [Hibiscus syriacus]|uniref:Avr9/Cf-9 rapidly elicited protein n=1 Tax=Hibiscus syriacus TaxID=106335 RepID=A0A6A3B6W9_HIBSY|nr:uncharacterized protein LOC120114845 [Hibiscus syriacus]KAE8712556.1 hypothetical protein F3Y22_tig00110247pilonHSYRG00079 [Hibiscus syriacus]